MNKYETCGPSIERPIYRGIPKEQTVEYQQLTIHSQKDKILTEHTDSKFLLQKSISVCTYDEVPLEPETQPFTKKTQDSSVVYNELNESPYGSFSAPLQAPVEEPFTYSYFALPAVYDEFSAPPYETLPSPTSISATADLPLNDSTAVTPSPSSWKEKFSRTTKKIKILTEGAAQIRAQGLSPKILQSALMIETVSTKHVLPRFSLQEEWLKSKTTDSFEVWVSKKEPIEHSKLKEVVYLDSKEREAYAVEIQNGKLTRHGKPYSTEKETTLYSNQGLAIFVQGPDKKFYIGSQSIGRFHHSSFLSGGAVISAGEIETDSEGTIRKVNNRSGHYLPGKEQNIAMLSSLKESGVDLSSVVFEEAFIGPDSNFHTVQHPNALEYLEAQEKLT